MTQTKQAQWIENTPPDELAQELFSFGNIKAEQTPLYYRDDNDVLKFRFHKYQKRAMRAKERFILLLGGTQSGKTSFGPIWLEREIKLRGAGDYLAIAPTYPLMKKKMLPEFLRYFVDVWQLGTYNKADKTFLVSDEGEIVLFGEEQTTKTIIYFGHAQDPDSLESATAKAAWLDECGQSKFRLASFEAIMRRLSLFMGRVLMTTTPYNLGWLKQKFWDVWEAGKAKAASLCLISFPSIANPSFPKDEYDRAKDTLPRWKFDMFYRAIFTRPAGMIYDCFDENNVIKRFPIPDNWKIYGGLDYGGVNTAVVKVAENPETKMWYAFSEYHNGGLTAKEHGRKVQSSHPISRAIGGAQSEGQWRLEFGAGGLPVSAPPFPDVELGINAVYGAFKSGQLVIFDDLAQLLDEIGSYSRETDEMGEPTEKIADKSSYHMLDALRYLMTWLNGGNAPLSVNENPFYN